MTYYEVRKNKQVIYITTDVLQANDYASSNNADVIKRDTTDATLSTTVEYLEGLFNELLRLHNIHKDVISA